MTNQIVLLRVRDTTQRGHGASQTTNRNFKLLINGEEWCEFSDHDSETKYHSGRYLDEHIEREIARLVRFFGGAVHHARLKDTRALS